LYHGTPDTTERPKIKSTNSQLVSRAIELATMNSSDAITTLTAQIKNPFLKISDPKNATTFTTWLVSRMPATALWSMRFALQSASVTTVMIKPETTDQGTREWRGIAIRSTPLNAQPLGEVDATPGASVWKGLGTYGCL